MALWGTTAVVRGRIGKSQIQPSPLDRKENKVPCHFWRRKGRLRALHHDKES
jgi:hypothetical protein